jgi:hypothetical protein
MLLSCTSCRAGALGAGRFGALVGAGDLAGADLSALQRALVQCACKLVIGLLILLPAWQGWC